MTPYEEVYKKFLKRVEDSSLPRFTEDVQAEILKSLLDTALMNIELQGINIKSDMTKRDDDLLEFDYDLTNSEMEIIAMYMVVAWYEPKINSLEHTLLMVGASGEKWTDQNKHLESMINVRDKVKLEARNLVETYNFKHNSYLGETK